MNSSTSGKYELYPSVNGLSDHDAKLSILVNEGKKRKRTVSPLSKEISISLPQHISYGNYVIKRGNRYFKGMM
jgi:hypothetical protein